VKSFQKGFTLIELMIVVAIVAILSLILVPMQSGHEKVSRLSEGIAGVGMIRTALRTYASAHEGRYPTLNGARGDELQLLAIASNGLNGKYLTPGDYSVTSAPTTYTIRATLPTDTSFWYQVDQDGNETRGSF